MTAIQEKPPFDLNPAGYAWDEERQYEEVPKPVNVDTDPSVPSTLRKIGNNQADRHQCQDIPAHKGVDQKVPTQAIYEPGVFAEDTLLKRQSVSAPQQLLCSDIDHQPPQPKQDQPPIPFDRNCEKRRKPCFNVELWVKQLGDSFRR